MSDENTQTASGVVVTFDMHPGAESPEWWTAPTFFDGKSLIDLLEDFDARVTFMVSDFKTVHESPAWRKLLSRILERHEVGGHTLNHGVWQPGSNPYAYWWSEVFPNYRWYLRIRQDYGLWNWPGQLHSFAYPFAQAGVEIGSLLLTVFSHLRGHNPSDGSGPLSYEEVRHAGTIGGGWLDRASFIPPPGAPQPYWWDTAWLSWLDDASRDSKYVTYGCHLPSWWEANPAKPAWADPVKVLEFFDYVKHQTRLPFIAMKDLPSVYPKRMDTDSAAFLGDLQTLADLQTQPH